MYMPYGIEENRSSRRCPPAGSVARFYARGVPRDDEVEKPPETQANQQSTRASINVNRQCYRQHVPIDRSANSKHCRFSTR
jgi:hypothetical protein